MDQNNDYNEWQTKAFNSQFQNNMNPEDYISTPFGAGPMQPFLGNFFSPNPVYNNGNNNADAFMHGSDFQPEVGLFNSSGFNQNGSFNTTPQIPKSQPELSNQSTPRPNPELNARAAELKAELMKRQKGRPVSATPPVTATATANQKKFNPETSGSMKGGSPITPATSAEKRDRDLNVNELISQYSTEPKTSVIAKMRQDRPIGSISTSNLLQTPKSSGIVGRPQVPASQDSPTKSGTKVTTKVTNSKQPEMKVADIPTRKSTASPSEGSEGEIREDELPPPSKLGPLAKPQANFSIEKVTRKDEPRKPPKDVQTEKSSLPRPQEASPVRRPPIINGKALPQRSHGERRNSLDRHPDKRPYQQDYANDQQVDKPVTMRQGSLDDGRRFDTTPASERTLVRMTKPPTLQDILPVDEDLREWLDITGYHNVLYRDKILKRRRQIAALDAERERLVTERERLVAEMEAEERGGISSAIVGRVSASSMLAPTPHNETGNPTSKVQVESLDPPVSSKRPYPNDRQENPAAAKIARLDDRISASHVKEEEEHDKQRPRSRGTEPPRMNDFREDRDLPRGQFERRARSWERDFSPGRRNYESKTPARTRPYEDAAPEREDFHDRDKRPFEVRGGYRGRAYDPNFRGRGRGRGRGRSHSREVEREREVEPSSTFGSKITNGKPYKDPKGFNRGGKGDTRYFIVKSFNEQNVIRCMEDSIWTTQIQNGEIFEEAFKTCRNVILVFSINKSRAFQGYARMESLPGSVDVPSWQKGISWESTGAFKVKWLVICSTKFHRVGHLKNSLNDHQAVLIGKDGQEIEEDCGFSLTRIIDDEAQHALGAWQEYGEFWDDNDEEDDDGTV